MAEEGHVQEDALLVRIKNNSALSFLWFQFNNSIM
jgi:hypothetical protein